MNGACNSTLFFGPAPGDLGRGQKVKYHSPSITYSHFQRFLNQTLYIFSQIKDIKHIRQDFHSVTWVMPLGVGLGGGGGLGGGQICLSVCHAIDSLTIGQNLTKFCV